MAKYFDQYFQIFSIFISNEGLPMIFTNALIKKTEETLIHQSMRKEKLRIARLCFIVGCFIKSFKMIINHFFFISQAHLQRSFCFLLSEWRRSIKRGNWERQIATDSKLQYLFNRLVMNVTQINIFYWQNVHIRRLIKVYNL